MGAPGIDGGHTSRPSRPQGVGGSARAVTGTKLIRAAPTSHFPARRQGDTEGTGGKGPASSRFRQSATEWCARRAPSSYSSLSFEADFQPGIVLDNRPKAGQQHDAVKRVGRGDSPAEDRGSSDVDLRAYFGQCPARPACWRKWRQRIDDAGRPWHLLKIMLKASGKKGVFHKAESSRPCSGKPLPQ